MLALSMRAEILNSFPEFSTRRLPALRAAKCAKGWMSRARTDMAELALAPNAPADIFASIARDKPCRGDADCTPHFAVRFGSGEERRKRPHKGTGMASPGCRTRRHASIPIHGCNCWLCGRLQFPRQMAHLSLHLCTNNNRRAL